MGQVLEVRGWHPDNHPPNAISRTGKCCYHVCNYGAVYSLRVRKGKRVGWYATCEFHRGVMEGRYPNPSNK